MGERSLIEFRPVDYAVNGKTDRVQMLQRTGGVLILHFGLEDRDFAVPNETWTISLRECALVY